LHGDDKKCGVTRAIRGKPRPSMQLRDGRQLDFPVVLPHSGILPKIVRVSDKNSGVGESMKIDRPTRQYCRYWSRLVRRRQALVETNLPRNSQLETHPYDERGYWPERSRPHRMDKFPHTLENSSRLRPRSGILAVLGCQNQISLPFAVCGSAP
jgi:hypothetical protein